MGDVITVNPDEIEPDRLMTQTEYARKIGTSQPNVAALVRRCSEQSGISPMVSARVWLDHPLIAEDLRKRGLDGDANTSKNAPVSNNSGAALSRKRVVTRDDIYNLTIAQIVSEFGSVEAYRSYIEISSKLVDLDAKQLKLAVQRGELISREFVEQHIFSYLEQMSSRLLAEACQQIAMTLRESALSGADIPAMQKEAHDVIAAIIAPSKRKAITNLEKA